MLLVLISTHDVSRMRDNLKSDLYSCAKSNPEVESSWRFASGMQSQWAVNWEFTTLGWHSWVTRLLRATAQYTIGKQ